jgi:xanthine dehydrogenase accessory factor
MRIWTALSDLVKNHGRCAMVTIVEVKGSAPREAGARMLVTGDGSYRGTIGGGALEWRAIAEAQAMISKGKITPRISSAVLGPDLGQCCGGQVKLLIETMDQGDLAWIDDLASREMASLCATELNLADANPRRRVVGGETRARATELAGSILHESFGEDHRHILLFGAGHIGRALILASAPLPFALTWIDPRPGSFPSALPANVSACQLQDPSLLLDNAPPGAFVVVMTHSHALDFDIVLRALKLGKFPYVGLIGSATKRARFVSRLRSAGIDQNKLDFLVCPIGIKGISSKHPSVIAAATAAELLVRDEQLRSAAHPLTESRRIA